MKIPFNWYYHKEVKEVGQIAWALGIPDEQVTHEMKLAFSSISGEIRLSCLYDTDTNAIVIVDMYGPN